MHLFILTVLIIGTFMSACQTEPVSVQNGSNGVAHALESTPKIVVTTTDTSIANRTAPRRVVLSGDDFMLSVEEPHEWESFTTEYGIVMGEEFSSVAAGGELKGLLVYIFASPLDEYTIATENVTDANIAQTIQMQIVTDPDYVGQARVNTPQSFDWQGYESSYYLLYDDTIDVMTMVMQIVIPESNMLLTNTVSAPRGQEARIRENLPHLFNKLKINGRHLDAAVLESLPAFDFPDPPQDQSS